MSTFRTFSTLFIGLTLTLTASSSMAQESYSPVAEDGAFRLFIGPQFGLGGETTLEAGPNELSGDLDPTFGLQVQGHIPFAKYFFVGPSVAWRSIQGEGGSDRVNIFGIDAVFGGRYAIDLGNIALEPFASVAIGLAVGTSDDFEDAEVGIDVGVRVGATAWFTPVVGAYLSLGYQFDKFFIEDDVTLSTGQFHLDLGVALRFGA